ncbi:UNVERIFIED_ORG: hypothetical protein GGI57_000455 [Rhizobium aethiopicum]
MPRFDLYDSQLVLNLGGQPLLERFAAKPIGGNSFAEGRTYEIMFISRMIIEMAFEWFSEDAQGIDPYDLAEGLECLVDDLMTRRGEDETFYQIKSGRITDRLVLKADFDNQQELDRRHGFEANYYLVVTPRFAPGISDWVSKHNVQCGIIVFPYATALAGLLPNDPALEDCLTWLTGSPRRVVWISLHRHIIGRWIQTREDSIHELFNGLANATRYQSPAILNDNVRLHAFFALLEHFEIYPDISDHHGIVLRSDFQDGDWFRIVPCTVEMLNEFDRWFSERDELSTGQLMLWFENYREEGGML